VDWIGLGWSGVDWIGLDWIGLDWIGLKQQSRAVKFGLGHSCLWLSTVCSSQLSLSVAVYCLWQSTWGGCSN